MQAIQSELDALEQLIPGLAREATYSAYLRALQVSRRGVLRIDDGYLVIVRSDGSKIIVAKGKPRHRVKPDEKVIVNKRKIYAPG